MTNQYLVLRLRQVNSEIIECMRPLACFLYYRDARQSIIAREFGKASWRNPDTVEFCDEVSGLSDTYYIVPINCYEDKVSL